MTAPPEKKKLAFHWKILFGMALGVLCGVLLRQFPWGKDFALDWVAPAGTLFIRLLKLIAIPLILTSLIKGIADLKDVSKFKNIGVRTLILYAITNFLAICIGLVLVNAIKPGVGMSEETVAQLTGEQSRGVAIASQIEEAGKQKDARPLDFIVDLVPDNIFMAMGHNQQMLQVIFFSVFLGVCMLLIKPEQAKPFARFVDSANDIVLKMVDVVMKIAPYAVFALLAQVVVSTSNVEVLQRLLAYGFTVLMGLALILVLYSLIIWFYVKRSPLWYFKGIAPSQLVAFSTSSSMATLPVTMDCATNRLGVDHEISSFIVPIGATVNMDGTSLYQAVAAVFIAQALHFPLEFSDQLTIVLTATLASIGTAAVPSAGMVMLIIVLESIGFPADKLAVGLALIFAIDRPLDMCRTVINVAGDTLAAVVVAKSMGRLKNTETCN